jgi:class 3 adenylate cyclase
MASVRRLTTILAADVAGYSRLLGAGEEGTLERLKALHRELLDPKIAEHRGRIVKTTGDGLLVEFASVVDAVRCVVVVQQAMPERNTGVAADKHIELRIGINLGDVIVEGDDLYGEGVNIAARIEALADPGEVFVRASRARSMAVRRFCSPSRSSAQSKFSRSTRYVAAKARFGEDIDAALALIDRALALNPSFASGWYWSGWLRLFADQPDLAIQHFETSLRLNPAIKEGSIWPASARLISSRSVRSGVAGIACIARGGSGVRACLSRSGGALRAYGPARGGAIDHQTPGIPRPGAGAEQRSIPEPGSS